MLYDSRVEPLGAVVSCSVALDLKPRQDVYVCFGYGYLSEGSRQCRFVWLQCFGVEMVMAATLHLRWAQFLQAQSC